MKRSVELSRLILNFLEPDILKNSPVIDPQIISEQVANFIDPLGESPPAARDGLLTYIRDQVIRVIRDPKTFEDMNVPNLLQPYYPIEDKNGWWIRWDCLTPEQAENWGAARAKAADKTLLKTYALKAHVRNEAFLRAEAC